MIEYKTGDLITEDSEALVNTVNCVGIMGRGIALQFKNAYPENFKAYSDACKRKEVQPGRMFVFETGRLINPLYIINFPTKRHWRGKARMEDIDSGLKALAKEISTRNIQSIAIPPLGSGLGGLNWSQVRPLIENRLGNLKNLKIIIFEPKGAPNTEKMAHIRNVPAMTPGRAALIGLIYRYLEGLLDPFVTLLEAHKLMYFMQAAGEPLKLKYKKATYGPYAENLRHVLHAIEGHFISGYAEGGDSPERQLKLVPGAIEDAKNYLKSQPATLDRLDKVSDLVKGFESPFGLEILSTIHWIAKHDKVQSVSEMIEKTYSWSEQKKCFSPRQIDLAIDVLSSKGWIKNLA